MRISVSGSIPRINVEAVMQDIKKQMRAVFYAAARKFLLAAVPRIPIWTGFARGAFRNLEDIVGKVVADGPGFRIRTDRKGGRQIGAYRKGYYYYPPGGGRIPRTPQTGREFATKQDDIFNFTGITLASGRNAFYFRFEVDITYVDYLDTAKWGAFKAGGDAFIEYVRANLALPNVGKFLLTRRGS